MRKILRVYEKSCIPIRKKSQLLYTIYRQWLLLSEHIKWKDDEVCPLNFSGVDNRLWVLQNTFKLPMGGCGAGGGSGGEVHQLKLWGLGSTLKCICRGLVYC